MCCRKIEYLCWPWLCRRYARRYLHKIQSHVLEHILNRQGLFNKNRRFGVYFSRRHLYTVPFIHPLNARHLHNGRCFCKSMQPLSFTGMSEIYNLLIYTQLLSNCWGPKLISASSPNISNKHGACIIKASTAHIATHSKDFKIKWNSINFNNKEYEVNV